nr:copper resistance CopC family protein [Arthrobacter roseus]
MTAVVVALLLAFAGLLPASGPAAAHDQISGTDPADGATVAQAPEEVALTFTGNPQGIGSEVQVMDTEGTDWATGEVKIVDNQAIQLLKPGAPAGDYTVNWRVVSADAHPIEGSFTFTATGGSVASAVPSQPIEEVAPAPAENVSDGGFPWGITAMIVVLIGLVVAIAVTARKRLGSTRDDDVV